MSVMWTMLGAVSLPSNGASQSNSVPGGGATRFLIYCRLSLIIVPAIPIRGEGGSSLFSRSLDIRKFHWGWIVTFVPPIKDAYLPSVFFFKLSITRHFYGFSVADKMSNLNLSSITFDSFYFLRSSHNARCRRRSKGDRRCCHG